MSKAYFDGFICLFLIFFFLQSEKILCYIPKKHKHPWLAQQPHQRQISLDLVVELSAEEEEKGADLSVE